MHTPTIVAQVMQCCSPLMHAARWRALHDVVVSAVNGHALGLVALAVGTPRTISVRHRVKCVDRLLGNIHLKAYRFDLYTALAQRKWGQSRLSAAIFPTAVSPVAKGVKS